MKLKYPHRLTFMGRGTCDVCGKQGKELIHTNAGRFFGWQSCDMEACNKTIQNWWATTTISHKTLLDIFGENVKVLRADATLDNNWRVFGDAHLEVCDGPHWVKVKCKSKHITKEVPLSLLLEWNNK